MFQCLYKQGDWFSFSKHRNTEGVCMDDSPSSLKKWKDKFFLIDRRAIPDYLTWRHSCSCVSDDLPADGYYRNDVERLCARLICLREMREEVLLHSGLKRVPSHTTAPVAKGAMIPLPTPNEIVASLLDPRLAKKSKGPSQARVRSASVTAPESGQPSKKRKPRKRYSKASSSAPKLGTSAGAASTPTPHIGKRLGAPPPVADASASRPSHGLTLVHASTSRRGLSLGGAVVSGYAGKSEAEVLRRQVNPLDSLVRSALACDVEYDQILEDDFGTATRGEEIDLTLFPLTTGPIRCLIPMKDLDVCRKDLDQTITPALLKRTESLLPLDLANSFNVLSALLVSHGAELNSRYTVTNLDGKLERMQKDCDDLVQKNRELRSQKDVASVKVKELQTKLTDARVASIGLSEELSQTDAKLSDQALVDAMDALREEVTQFIGSGVESLVRKLLSSDEFHAALARVASLDINYDVKRGLRMGHTDVEFEAAVQKVSNFHVGAEADFDKALVDFPTIPFPFLNKIVAASGGTLSEVTQVSLDKHICSVTPTSVVPSIVNEDADQVSLSTILMPQPLLFIGELSWEGEDFVLPPFHWKTYVFLSFAHVVA
ncbi:hypothetical protein Tco_0791721 [Tanacetum coccineum]